MPSSTCACAAAMSLLGALPGREYCGRPPTTSTRHGAPSVLRLVDGAAVVVARRAAACGMRRPGTCRRGNSPESSSPASRICLGTRARGRPRRPGRATGDRADAVPRAGLDDARRSEPCLRTVAVLMRHASVVAARSRASDCRCRARPATVRIRAQAREVGIAQQAGRVGEAEQFGEMHESSARSPGRRPS